MKYIAMVLVGCFVLYIIAGLCWYFVALFIGLLGCKFSFFEKIFDSSKCMLGITAVVTICVAGAFVALVYDPGGDDPSGVDADRVEQVEPPSSWEYDPGDYGEEETAGNAEDLVYNEFTGEYEDPEEYDWVEFDVRMMCWHADGSEIFHRVGCDHIENGELREIEFFVLADEEGRTPCRDCFEELY